MFDYENLKLIWWVLVGVLLIGFALTDGFDLGAMLLMPEWYIVVGVLFVITGML